MMMYLLAILTASQLLFASPVGAGTNVWTSGGPEGASITAITVDPELPSTLYIGASGIGILKSTDSGATWQQANEGLPEDCQVSKVVIDPFMSSHLYAALTYSGIYKSTDAGAHWMLINSARSYDIAADPQNAGILFSAGYSEDGERVIKSTDSGLTWTPASQGLPGGECYSLAIPPGANAAMYAGTRSGVYKSLDRGLTWLPQGLTWGSVYKVGVDPSQPEKIYAVSIAGVYGSADAGTTWTDLLDVDYDWLTSLAVAPGVVYVGDLRRIWKSTDAGASWVENQSPLPEEYVEAIAVDPSDPAHVYAGACDGFRVSTDAGATWGLSNSGLSALRMSTVAIDPDEPNVAFAGGRCGGIFKTTNGGSSWFHVSTGFRDNCVIEIAIDASTPNNIYATLQSQPLEWAGGIDQVIRSTDGGNSWSRAQEGLGLPWRSVRWIVIDPVKPNILYAPNQVNDGNLALFRTRNSGTKWREVSLLDDWEDLSRPGIDPSNRSTLYMGVDLMIDPVGCDFAILKSTDAGLNWTSVYADFLFYDFDCMFSSLLVDPSSSDIVYAAWDKGVLKSTDAGASWEDRSTGLPEYGAGDLIIDKSAPLVLYSATNSGVFKTRDGGLSWSAMNDGLGNRRVHSLALSPSNRNILFAATVSGVYSIEQEQECLFCDDFEDGDASDWQLDDDWSVIGGYLTGSSTRTITALSPTIFTGCTNCSVSSTIQISETFPGMTTRVSLLGWYQDNANYIELTMKEGEDVWLLRQWQNGTVVARRKFSAVIEPAIPYHVMIAYDGSALQLYIDNRLKGTVEIIGNVFGTAGFRVRGGTATFAEIVIQ